MRLELQKIRIDGDNQDRGEGSEMSTDLTHGKIIAQSSTIMKPSIQKVLPKVNMDLPERCPLCNSIPPCAHYQEHSVDLVKSVENPIIHYDEEVKRFNYNKLNEKSKFNSSNKLASRDDINQILTPNKRLINSIPREFEQEFQDQQKDSALKSYAEIGFVSPKLGSIVTRANITTDSVSVPFNFTSEDANGRSSIYSNSAQQEMQNSRSRRLWKAGASIISGGMNTPAEKKTTVRIRGKQTEMMEGMIDKTLEQQEKLKTQRKEIRRANERLKNLEKLEKFRQEKVRIEIERLEQERRNEEMNRQRRLKEDNDKRAAIAKQKKEILAAKEEREKHKKSMV